MTYQKIVAEILLEHTNMDCAKVKKISNRLDEINWNVMLGTEKQKIADFVWFLLYFTGTFITKRDVCGFLGCKARKSIPKKNRRIILRFFMDLDVDISYI